MPIGGCSVYFFEGKEEEDAGQKNIDKEMFLTVHRGGEIVEMKSQVDLVLIGSEFSPDLLFAFSV